MLLSNASEWNMLRVQHRPASEESEHNLDAVGKYEKIAACQ